MLSVVAPLWQLVFSYTCEQHLLTLAASDLTKKSTTVICILISTQINFKRCKSMRKVLCSPKGHRLQDSFSLPLTQNDNRVQAQSLNYSTHKFSTFTCHNSFSNRSMSTYLHSYTSHFFHVHVPFGFSHILSRNRYIRDTFVLLLFPWAHGFHHQGLLQHQQDRLVDEFIDVFVRYFYHQ